jgi:hypothetical protein
VLVVADEDALGIGGERRLSRAREAEEDREIVLVGAVVRRAVHREYPPRREEVRHHRKDGLLDLSGIVASADDHFPAVEVENDEHLAPGPVFFRDRVEAGSVDDRELGNVVPELFRVVLANEHVAREEVVPGAGVDDANGDPVLGVSSDVAVLDEDVPALEVGGETGPEPRVVFGLERLRRIPPDVLFARRLANDVLVVGGAPGVLAGVHHEGPLVGHEPLSTLDGLLVESAGREVPPFRGVDDSVLVETVMARKYALFFHSSEVLLRLAPSEDSTDPERMYIGVEGRSTPAGDLGGMRSRLFRIA